MKISNLDEKTSIMVGDVVVINNKEQTLKIKRGKEFLLFENFEISSEHKCVIEGNLGEELSIFDDVTTIKDWFAVILSAINLTAYLTIGGAGKPNEEWWHITQRN